ncbi:MAG: hypothetical protein WCJ58_02975 [bacterium]
MSDVISKKYFIGRTIEKGKWSSVYFYKPHNPEIKDQLGQVAAIVSLSSPPGFSIATAGNLLLDFFHETYYETNEPNMLLALERAVIASSKQLQKLMQNDLAAKAGIEMDFTAVAIKNNVAYFVNMGEGHIFIFRDGNLTHLSRHLKDPLGTKLITEGSMFLKSADVITLCTPTAFEEISQDELIDAAVDFSELKLKNKHYSDESQIAFVLIGYNVDRRESQQEHSLHDRIEKEVNVELNQILSKPVAQGQEQDQIDNGDEVQITETNGDEETIEQDQIDSPEIENIDTIPVLAKIQSAFAHPSAASMENLEEPSVIEGNQDNNEVTEGFNLNHEGETKPKKLKLFSGIKNKLLIFWSGITARFPKKSLKVLVPEHTPVLEMEHEQEYIPESRFSEKPQTGEKDKLTYKVISDRIKRFFYSIGSVIKTVVWQNWLGMGSKELFVRGTKIKRKANVRILIIIAVVVICLLYFSIKGIKSNMENKKLQDEYQTKLTNAESLLSEVSELAPIKAKSPFSDPSKKELFNKLSEAVTLLNQVKTYQDLKDKAEIDLIKIIDFRDLLNQIIAVKNPEQLIDFGASYPGANTVDMVAGIDFLYVIDKQYGKVYKTGTDGKASEIVSGLNQPRSITMDDQGNLIVLDNDSDKALIKINQQNEVTRLTGMSSFRVGGINVIEFSEVVGGRIYGIDTKIKQLDYLARSGDTYAFPAKRTTLDAFSSATDLQVIDQKIYVLCNNKQGIFRFYNDKDDTPTISGLPPGESILNASAFYIDGLYVYVADPVNQRILIFSKSEATDLKFITQYAYRGNRDDGFKNIREIFANRTKNVLYILDSDIIYKISLADLPS